MRGRGLHRETPGRGPGMHRDRTPQAMGHEPPARGSQRGYSAPSVLEHPLGLSGPTRSIRPVNLRTTRQAYFTLIFIINQGGGGGWRRNLLICGRGPDRPLAVKPAFRLERTSVNEMSRSSYGEDPPMGGGYPPPAPPPEHPPEAAPLLIQASSWHEPPEAPKNAVSALRMPQFPALKPAKMFS